jgi:hypothetical protein
MSNIARSIRFVAAAAVLGLSLGAFAAANTSPLYGNDQSIQARGHGHIEPDGAYFCHCSGDACLPCGAVDEQ